MHQETYHCTCALLTLLLLFSLKFQNIVVSRMSAQVIFPFSHTGFAENLADPINQYGKGTTSYILRRDPLLPLSGFYKLPQNMTQGSIIGGGTEMTARGIQVKQKDSRVRGMIFWYLT